MNYRGILVTEYLIALGLITYSEWLNGGGNLPPPSRYFKGSLAFGLLGIAMPLIGPVAPALGAGLILAVLYQGLPGSSGGNVGPTSGAVAQAGGIAAGVSAGQQVGSAAGGAIGGLINKLKGQPNG